MGIKESFRLIRQIENLGRKYEITSLEAGFTWWVDPTSN
jgi:hypothetical protein